MNGAGRDGGGCLMARLSFSLPVLRETEGPIEANERGEGKDGTVDRFREQE